MHHQHWVGRAAERCLDASSSVGGGDALPPEPPPPGPTQCALEGPSPAATTSSVECVGVRVCVPECTTSTGLAGQPNGAWRGFLLTE